MSQRIQKPPKVDPEYLQNGSGGSLGGWTPFWHESGTLLGLHLAAQMTPRDAKVILNGAKWRQKDVKFLLKIDVKITIHFHTPFYTKT